jgi:nucleotide-binding universal stress UspA family protein
VAQLRVVVGYESAQRSAHVLAAAVELAGRIGAGLEVVQVREAVVSPAPSSAVGLPLDPGGAVVTAPLTPQRLAELEEGLRGELAPVLGDVETSVRVVQGWPPDVLRAVADEVDAYLLVLGGPGHGFGAFVEHLVTGSVTHELERRSTRPLLVVPGPG